jgi:hypothetical protein
MTTTPATSRKPSCQSFLVLFFKKEHPSLLRGATRKANALNLFIEPFATQGCMGVDRDDSELGMRVEATARVM